MTTRWTAADVPDQSGRVAVVTGANTGIGYEAATVRAATDPAVQGGQYYGPSGFQEAVGHPVLVESNAKSHDVAIQQRLWTVSEELTGVKYGI